MKTIKPLAPHEIAPFAKSHAGSVRAFAKRVAAEIDIDDDTLAQTFRNWAKPNGNRPSKLRWAIISKAIEKVRKEARP